MAENDGTTANLKVTFLVTPELALELGEWSTPVQIKVTETPGSGSGWEMVARVADLTAYI